MIPTKIRSRRVKASKLSKNLDRLYKEGKCRECAIVVTRMDFAKILGKFTKVKIQYESNKTPKTKQVSSLPSPNSNARLKSNENGMVLLHRKAYNQHPVKEQLKSKEHIKTKEQTKSKKTNNIVSPSVANNILKENNRLRKPIVENKFLNIVDRKEENIAYIKQYGIVFEDPLVCNNNNYDINCKISLTDLLPVIDDSILPSEDWCIDYFPKKDEPKDDQVYDRIAAELEDLMYNEKPIAKLEDKADVVENKVDDFPSIMDILNDNSSENKVNDQSNSLEFKSNLESSDVEAMLLGKSNTPSETLAPTPMDVDNTNMGNVIEDQLTTIQDTISNVGSTLMNEDSLPTSMISGDVDNPHSPSILDEALQEGIEQHLPVKDIEPGIEGNIEDDKSTSTATEKTQLTDIDVKEKVNEVSANTENTESNNNIQSKERNILALKEGITHVVFKNTKDGTCLKSVTCPKSLKYCIEMNAKSVEFIGAPKIISSLEDLKVLLQIVNESELDSLYVLH